MHADMIKYWQLHFKLQGSIDLGEIIKIMSPRQLFIPFQPFYMQNFDKDADRVGRKFAEASQAGLEVSKRYNMCSVGTCLRMNF